MSRKHRRKHESPKPTRARSWAWLAFFIAAVPAFAIVAHRFLPFEREIPPGRLAGANLLFVTIDTLRADHLGVYGSRAGLTPRLDRLASEGIVFEEALSHVPLTLPSHASIFTAKYPTSHGVHDNGTFRLDGKQKTLASILKGRGYQTSAFVGAFVLDARFGVDQGFDQYDDYYGEKRAFESFVELERRADDVLTPAERWLEETNEGPWFTWVHLFDPHAPYEAPETFRSAHPDDPYGAEIAYVDDALGRFLDRLDAAGALENTLLVVLGDHGESLGEHGESTHGTFAYDATLHVPWILRAEGLGPSRFPGRVRLVDVVPTILDLLGVDPPMGIDGASLRPFLADPSRYRAPDSYFEALNPHLTRDWAPLRGLVHDRFKYVDLPIPELYDREADPREERNLARDRAATVTELSRALETVVKGDTGLEPNSADREIVKRLASLGYVVSPRTDRRQSGYSESDDPKTLVAWSNAQEEAAGLFTQGRTKEAVARLRGLLEEQPRSSFAHQKLAYALHQIGRPEEAVRVLEDAVENGSSDVSLLTLLASYLLETGDVTKASAILEPLVEAHPEFTEGRNLLGVVEARLGRAEESRRQFESVLALDPSSASTYNNLGSLALSRGDGEAAVVNFEKALSLDSDLASAYNGLGVARARRGEMDEAIEAWSQSVQRSPQQFDALYNLAMALAEKDPGRAVPYLERFVREAPSDQYREDVATARELLTQLRDPS
jgi:arylsulfatase A-like enzyme/Flp pilus assembly protein TadD